MLFIFTTDPIRIGVLNIVQGAGNIFGGVVLGALIDETCSNSILRRHVHPNAFPGVVRFNHAEYSLDGACLPILRQCSLRLAYAPLKCHCRSSCPSKGSWSRIWSHRYLQISRWPPWNCCIECHSDLQGQR